MLPEDGNPNEYKSRDLYESAYLYAANASLLRVQKTITFIYFIFDDFNKCFDLRNEYWSYRGKVPPKKYADAIRSLKDLIYAENR